MSVTLSRCASACAAAVLSGDRSIDPSYTAARKLAKPIERHKLPPRENPIVYAVTTIAGGQAYGGTRTVALCNSFFSADEMLRENVGDLHECSYGLAVVELVTLNQLYGGDDRPRYWYAWIDGRYQPIEAPEGYDFAGIDVG